MRVQTCIHQLLRAHQAATKTCCTGFLAKVGEKAMAGETRVIIGTFRTAWARCRRSVTRHALPQLEVLPSSHLGHARQVPIVVVIP